ncbi:MAG: TldD/PmbA family protein [Brevinematia bacterium]
MYEDIKEKLKKIPADFAEFHFEEVLSTRIVYTRQNIELFQTSKTSSGNVRIFYNGGWGFSSFNEKDIDRAIEEALENARIVSTNLPKKINILRLSPIVEDVSTQYRISPLAISPEEKNELVKNYNDMLQDEKIASTKVTYSDWKSKKYYLNSEGSNISVERIFTGISYGAMAKDGTNVQQAFESIGQYGGWELVVNLESRIEEVKKRALDLLKAKKVESGKYLVLLNPLLAGVFAHEAFGHLSEADFISENPKMQKIMKIGRVFGPEFLNIIDDGSIPDLAGYTPYDDEGVKASKTYLIKNGRLYSRLHSRETAYLMNENVTGNARAINSFHQPIVRMTNTYIDNGTSTFDEMIEQIDDGIYALDYLGGMTNLEMFTFSSGYAYRIKNGKKVELIRDVNLSGNVFTTLKNIVAIGNDIEHHGGLGGCGKGGQNGLPVSTGSPHILVKDVLVGGV